MFGRTIRYRLDDSNRDDYTQRYQRVLVVTYRLFWAPIYRAEYPA